MFHAFPIRLDLRTIDTDISHFMNTLCLSGTENTINMQNFNKYANTSINDEAPKCSVTKIINDTFENTVVRTLQKKTADISGMFFVHALKDWTCSNGYYHVNFMFMLLVDGLLNICVGNVSTVIPHHIADHLLCPLYITDFSG